MSARYDFQARNRLGVVLRTFGDLETARRWAKEHQAEHDGVHVVAVTVITTERVVYRPQIRRVA